MGGRHARYPGAQGPVNKHQILSWLPMVGSKALAEQNRTGWVLATCPMKWNHSGKPSPHFAVRIEQGDSFVNCFSCAYHGSQSQMTIEVGYRNKKDPYGPLQVGEALQLIAQAEDGMELDLSSPDVGQLLFEEAKPKPAVFPETWLASFPDAWDNLDSRAYLQGRGVPEEISNGLGLRCDTKQSRVCFPVRDFNGVLRGLHGRAMHDTDPLRYRMYNHGGNNPVIWLGEHWVDLDKPIVVVEGPFDLTSVMRVYRNVVSPLFANPSFDKLRRMQDAMEWITLLDNGTGGNKGRARVSEVIGAHKIKHSVTHLTPPAGKDPGSMLVGELVQLLEPYLDLDEILLA